MNNGEFYRPNEYNTIQEYKSFPAEIYSKSVEHNSSGAEIGNTGKEITTVQKRTKRNSRDGTKSFIEKVFNSVKNVATTATVAAATVVVTVGIVITQPKVNVESFDYGADYVEYKITLDEMSEDITYSTVISNSSDEDVVKEFTDEGVCEARVDNLRPDWEYTLKVVGTDASLNQVIYHETTFQTLKNIIYPSADIHISTNKIPEDMAFYIDYQAIVSDFKNGTEYRLVAEYNGTEFYENTVITDGKIEGRIENIPYDVFDFVIYATVSGEEKELLREEYISPVFDTPTASIKTNTTKISEDMVFYVDYEALISMYENAKSYRLVAEYNGTEFYENTVITEGKIEGRIEDIPYDVFDFVIYATVSGEEKELLREEYISPVFDIPSAGISVITNKTPSTMEYSVDYNISISDYVNGKNYRVVFVQNGATFYENNAINNGAFSARVEDLPPGEFEIIVYGQVKGIETMLEKSTYVPPIFEPPTSYDGSYIAPSLSNSSVIWNDSSGYHTFKLHIECDDMPAAYKYILSALDSNGNTLDYYEGRTAADVVLDIPVSSYDVSFVFEIIGIGTNSTSVIEKIDLGEIDFSPASVEITDVAIPFINTYNIKYSILGSLSGAEIYEGLELVLNFADGSKNTVAISKGELHVGYIEYTTSIEITSIDATLTYTKAPGENVRMASASENISTDASFNATHLVNFSSDYVLFHPVGILDGATHMAVVSSENPTAPDIILIEDIEPNAGYMSYYSSGGDITYTLYLCDEFGNALSNQVTATVDTTANGYDGSYSMSYRNPSDIGISYNDDGTINLYIDIDYPVLDGDAYYQIVIGGNHYFSFTSGVPVISGLPDEPCTVEFRVCKDIGGIPYVLYEVIPSGVINEADVTHLVDATKSGSTVNVNMTYLTDKDYDVNTPIRIVCSDGTELSMEYSELYNDTGNSMYVATFEVDADITSITVYVGWSAAAQILEVMDYDGNMYKINEIYFEF